MAEIACTFFSKLEKRVQQHNTLLCVGLDPHKAQLPHSEIDCALLFCLSIIERTSKFAAAYKPNSAFFESFGAEGLAALKTVIASIPADIPVILDCKRGDIDTTAMAYADSVYEYERADCVTLSPYMGWDSVAPFVTGQYSHKGAFVLCKTSNKSSTDMQDLQLASGGKVFQHVIELCNTWNAACRTTAGHECLGLVVGATDCAALASIRNQTQNTWILCPGVGSQGGDLLNACMGGLRSDGSGMLISVSRGISGAADVEEAARQYRDDINSARALKLQAVLEDSRSAAVTVLQDFQREFIKLAIGANVLQFGQFTLKSGRSSPYFFNAGNFCNGLQIRDLGRSYARALHARPDIAFDVLFGPAYKGIPIATAIAVALFDLYGTVVDVTYNRKEAKDHGEGGTLVGSKVNGRRVLVVDDVITAGTAIREAMDILAGAQAVVVGVVVCLDRQEAGSNKDRPEQTAIQQVEADFGIPVVSIVSLAHLVDYVTTDCEDTAIVEAMKLVGK